MNKLLFVVFCLIFIATLIVLLMNVMRKGKIAKFQKKLEENEEKITKLKSDLVRLKIISKTDQMKEEFNKFENHFDEMLMDTESIKKDFLELQENNSLFSHSKVYSEISILQEDLDEVNKNLVKIDEDICKLNDYEKSTQQHIVKSRETLKTVMKYHEENKLYLGDFEQDYNEKIAEIKINFKELEEMMRDGEHQESRKNSSIIEKKIKLIQTNDQLYIYAFKESANVINVDLKQILDLTSSFDADGILPETYSFDVAINDFKRINQEIFQQLLNTKYKAIFEPFFFEEIKEKIEILENKIADFKEIVIKERELKDEIEEIEKVNKERIELLDTIFPALFEEREDISQKYNILNPKEIFSIEVDADNYKAFNEQYAVLSGEFHKGKIMYRDAVEDFRKASNFLIRINNKVVAHGEKLRRMREDEKQALECIPKFKKQLAELQAYITYYDFTNKLTMDNIENLNEINEKIIQLDEKLKADELEIERIGTLNQSITDLIAIYFHDIQKQVETTLIIEQYILNLNIKNEIEYKKAVEDFCNELGRLIRDKKYSEAMKKVNNIINKSATAKADFETLTERANIIKFESFVG